MFDFSPWWWIPILLLGVPLIALALLCIVCLLTDCTLCEEPDDPRWFGG